MLTKFKQNQRQFAAVGALLIGGLCASAEHAVGSDFDAAPKNPLSNLNNSQTVNGLLGEHRGIAALHTGELINNLEQNYIAFNSKHSLSKMSNSQSIGDFIHHSDDSIVSVEAEAKELKIPQSTADKFLALEPSYKIEPESYIQDVSHELELASQQQLVITPSQDVTSQTQYLITPGIYSLGVNLDDYVDDSEGYKLPEARRIMANLGFQGQSRSRKESVSIATSREQVLHTLSKMRQANRRLGLEQMFEPISTAQSIQFIDERSDLIAKDIFPAVNLDAAIIGSELLMSTDGLGYVHLSELPELSDVLIASGDDNGIYMRMIHEIRTTDKPESGVTRLKVVRRFSFNMWTQMAGIVENVNYGQLCGQVYGQDLTDGSGVSVSVGAESDGVYYFNQLGYLDRRLTETSSNGKFCIFNVETGPSLVRFDLPDERSVEQISTVRAGYLSFLDFFDEDVEGVVRFGVAGSAYEQLSDDKTVENSMKVVDYVDLELFESSSESRYLEAGSIEFKSLTREGNGMFHIGVDVFELEPAIYRLPSSYAQGDYVVPLYPRGFAEDLAVMSNISFDSSLGQVVVNYGLLSGENGNDLEIELFDDLGNPVSEAVYFDEAPVLKAAFYDVADGRYMAIVKDSEKNWLGSSVVEVIDGRMSIVMMGRQFTARGSYCDAECLAQ